MKQIYIVRHGQTDFNLKSIIQGSGVDSSLNETGIEQGALFHRFYRHVPFDIIYASTLKRTKQTIQPFIDGGIPIEYFAEINEINWGIHEGKASEPWMIESYNKLISAWKSGDYDARIPEGESANELATRLKKFVEVLKNCSHERILVCTHGRTLRCLIAILKEEEPTAMEKYKHHNTGVYKAIYKDDKFEITIENDIGHLIKKPTL